MTPKELLIDALKTLCNDTPGGFRAVADTIGVDDQTLYQITKGVKLPSGEPRGVGPKLQRKLAEHYPGWATMAASDHKPTPEAQEQLAKYEAKRRDWPFKRVRLADVQQLSDADLGYIEGQLMAALRDIGASASSKANRKRAV